MITVHVWRFGGKQSVGHASMTIGVDTYISWWPARNEFGLLEKIAPLMGRTYQDDVRDEGRPADRTTHIGGLDENAIRNWWRRVGLSWRGQQVQGPPDVPYVVTDTNCSKIVALALKIGGGDKHATWSKSWNVVWTPNDVWEYASSIGQKR